MFLKIFRHGKSVLLRGRQQRQHIFIIIHCCFVNENTSLSMSIQSIKMSYVIRFMNRINAMCSHERTQTDTHTHMKDQQEKCTLVYHYILACIIKCSYFYRRHKMRPFPFSISTRVRCAMNIFMTSWCVYVPCVSVNCNFFIGNRNSMKRYVCIDITISIHTRTCAQTIRFVV